MIIDYIIEQQLQCVVVVEQSVVLWFFIDVEEEVVYVVLCGEFGLYVYWVGYLLFIDVFVVVFVVLCIYIVLFEFEFDICFVQFVDFVGGWYQCVGVFGYDFVDGYDNGEWLWFDGDIYVIFDFE